MIDLHLHSTFSDGELSPSEVVQKAKQEGISVLSLTDHDSTLGWKEAKETCDKLGIRFIPGVELEAATNIAQSKYIHILGYNFTNHKVIEYYLQNLMHERIYIVKKYVELFEKLGIKTSFEEILSITPGLHLTAYNIPIFLCKNGYFNDFNDAKEKFINPSSEYYIPRSFYNVDFIIDLIIKAGGIPVIAHPYRLPQKGNELETYIANLKQKGIVGIETYYSEHSQEDIAFYEMLAKKYNLLQTVGSDWHSSEYGIPMGLSVSNEEEIVNSLLNLKGNS